MTDSSADLSWVCPACDRRVPRKFKECRCGYTPNRAEASPADAPGAPPRTTVASAAGVIGGVVVALAAIIVGAWYVNRPSTPVSSEVSAQASAVADAAPDSLHAGP